MKKSPIVDHLEVAMALAQYERMPFVAYLIAMAKKAVDQSTKEAA